MSEDDSQKRRQWMVLILPGFLAAVLGAVGWGAVEYWSSYKEFVTSDIKISDLNGKLNDSQSKLKILTEKNNALSQSLKDAKKNLKEAALNLETLSDIEAKLTQISDKHAALQEEYTLKNKELSRALSDNKKWSNKLSRSISLNRKLQKQIDENNIQLGTCKNQPSGMIHTKNLSRTFTYSNGREMSSNGVNTLASGQAWIKVESIGHDDYGNFAMVRSSLFDQANASYCVRTGNAIEISDNLYLGIYSIGEELHVEYYKK